MSEESKVLALSRVAHAAGDHSKWFEALYATAKGDAGTIPWADLAPNPGLDQWLKTNADALPSGRALVIGCGLGDDAEALSAIGLDVVAFDISRSAVEWAQKRFPDSAVTYQVADLLNPPASWRGHFDFIFEAYTLQVFPESIRAGLMDDLSGFLAKAGQLLLICRGREPDAPLVDLPWPLSEIEIQRFDTRLTRLSFEDYDDDEDPPERRFRALFRASSDDTPPA